MSEQTKTIAQQLNIKEFPFTVKDKNNNQIYHEDSSGYWYKSEYDSNSNQIYYENSDGYWRKSEYDSNSNKTYSEDSNERITDNRPKEIIELTIHDIAEKFNLDADQLRIKE